MLLPTSVLAMMLSGQAAIPGALDVQPSQPPQAQAQPEPKAQDSQEQKPEAKEPPTPPHTGIHALFGDLVEDVKHLPAMQNVYIAAIGGGLAVAAHPADQTLNAKLISHYDAVNTTFAPGKYL